MTAEAAASSTPAAAGTVLDDNPEVTRSYSEAIVAAASTAGAVAPVLDDLDTIVADVLGKHPRLGALLASPLVSAADKDQVIVNLFEGKANPVVVRFLRVLNRHGRLESLGSIARAARVLWDKRENRRAVHVRSAVPLDGAQRAALDQRLAQMVAATPVVTVEVDPSLIGGLVIQVGDDVYDASVKNQLEQLRQRLIEGKTHGKV